MIIYITKNLINGKKYIGKDSHNNPKYLGSGTFLLEDIKKFGKQNFKKEILEYCKSNEELSVREIYWIKFFDAVRSDMFYNIVESSGGYDFSKMNEEKYKAVCKKISDHHKGMSRPYLKIDQVRKDKLRQANKGKPKPAGFGDKISKIKRSKNIVMSQETKDKISKAKKGHACFKTEHFKSTHYKPIAKFDKEGNLIQEFKSILEAEQFNEKYKSSNISSCLTGISKTAYGFIWRYL